MARTFDSQSEEAGSKPVRATIDLEGWECSYCGWTLKFKRGRTDVSTWCDKCHADMEQFM